MSRISDALRTSLSLASGSVLLDENNAQILDQNNLPIFDGAAGSLGTDTSRTSATSRTSG